MKSIINKLALCLLLGAPMGAHATFVAFPDGEFSSGQGTWGEAGPGLFSYPSTGGNPGGYGAIDATAAAWGVLVSSNDDGSFIPLASLGLVPGNGYNFQMDMRIEAGSPNILGELKLEWNNGNGDTTDLPSTYIDANWNTHTYPVIIPAGATGVKVVPVANDGNNVGFDNIGFDDVPYFIAPPPPTPPADCVYDEPFDTDPMNWGAPTGVPGGVTATATWSATGGNPDGSTVVLVTNPVGAGANVGFKYTATGIDFGDGPVQISFDVKGTFGVGTLFDVTYNGNGAGNQGGSVNGATYSTITKTYDVSEGFTGTDTFTLDFNIVMGAVVDGGANISVDNIKILTNATVPPPFTAAIAIGKTVDWTPTSDSNCYQPQKEVNAVWTDLGPSYMGTEVTGLFDASPVQNYRVEEVVKVDEISNGSFEVDFFGFPDFWESAQIPPAWIDTDSYTGVYSVQFMVGSAQQSEISQNLLDGGGSVTEGAQYTFSMWVKQISIGGISYESRYRVQWLDSVGGELPGALPFTNFTATVGGDWEQVTQSGPDLIAPVGATSALVQIIVLTGAVSGASGEVLVDDVSLTRETGVVNILPATSVSAAEISWQSVTGTTYQVGSSTDLNGFTDFGSPVIGDGTIKAVYDSPLVTKKFYQVSDD